MHRHHLQAKPVLNKYVGGQKEMDIFIKGNIMDSYFGQKQQFKIKMTWWICFLQTCSILLHKSLIDRHELMGSHVDYLLYVFFSCLDSHSDGTHSQQRIHWWASIIAKFLQIILTKKQTHQHIWDGPKVSQLFFRIFFFFFGLTITIK